MDVALLHIQMFTGIHNDPRAGHGPVLYGLGSYVEAPLPVELEYVYFTLRNVSDSTLFPESFYLENLQNNSRQSIEPGLARDAFAGVSIAPGKALTLGFLRDLLTRKLLFAAPDGGALCFRAVCTLQNAQQRPQASAAYTLDPAYPSGPLNDVELSPWHGFLNRRTALFHAEMARITKQYGTLCAYAGLHHDLGLHDAVDAGGRPVKRLREWMPAAAGVWLTTDRVGFRREERYAFSRTAEPGVWQLDVPPEELPHGTYMELLVASPDTPEGPDGPGANGVLERRVPAFAGWVEQDREIPEQWCARVWAPENPHVFRHDAGRKALDFPRIYEAHIGIAQPSDARTETSVGTYDAFRRDILPRIAQAGYTAVQLMGVLEHPLYKSFGYQVSSYFAPSSRFGTPDAFRNLVDAAHALGLAVILDIPHSHSAPNTEQGIARYDTSAYLFSEKGNQWGTLSFDYSNEMARRFLLSNCRHWIESFHVDGFRFDAVGNMIYVDHGFGDDFSHVGRCFLTADNEARIDEAGVLYLQLANTLVRELYPPAVTLAEEFSGMPGMTSAPTEGGLGFDYRFAMGIPDFWGKWIKEGRPLGMMWHEMTNRRSYERTVSYVACHDQCINGKDAMIWRLIGDEMYTHMSHHSESWKASRGVALYKMMRLLTLGTAAHGWLNFMGDEFGHPEWIDAGAYGHRQWHLAAQDDTKYQGLATFDRAMLELLPKDHRHDFGAYPNLRLLHEADALLAFERGRLLVVFNFHELEARRDVKIQVTPGKYTELLSTDSTLYSGHGNLEASAGREHFTSPCGVAGLECCALYLPPLTALVLVRDA